MTAESRIDKAQAVAWAEAAVAKQRSAWNLHTAGLAYCRAGQLDKAQEALQASLKTNWVSNSLNWVVLGIIKHELGNDEAAREFLDKARAWRDEVANKNPGPANAVAWDWVEFHVLLPELEARLAQGPVKGKRADPGKPKEPKAQRSPDK